MPDSLSAAYTFRVEGNEDGQRSYVKPFDETFEVEAENIAEALRKLASEIEWGILDGEAWFAVTFFPKADE